MTTLLITPTRDGQYQARLYADGKFVAQTETYKRRRSVPRAVKGWVDVCRAEDGTYYFNTMVRGKVVFSSRMYKTVAMAEAIGNQLLVNQLTIIEI